MRRNSSCIFSGVLLGVFSAVFSMMFKRCLPGLLVSLAAISCASSMQKQKDSASRTHVGASGVQQACLQAGLMACDELRMSYEQFAQNDPGTARKHIRNVLAHNEGVALNSLTQTLNVAAQISGNQGRIVQRFSAFLYSVVQGNTSAMQSVNTRNNATRELFHTGCTYDSQCKFDRVCINGECVSERYREAIEAQYMASSKGIVMPAPNESEAGDGNDIELELLFPQLGDEVLLCKPDQVLRCMKKCEKGDAPNCFAVGKLYEKLPHNEQHNAYMLFAYNKACASGLSDACIDLGNLHFYGRFGQRNMELAYQFNLSACEHGNGIGCVNTARLLRSGKGVAQNTSLADSFYNRACEHGQTDYCMSGAQPAAATIEFDSPDLPAHAPAAEAAAPNAEAADEGAEEVSANTEVKARPRGKRGDGAKKKKGKGKAATAAAKKQPAKKNSASVPDEPVREKPISTLTPEP